jgi:hypothetical protein
VTTVLIRLVSVLSLLPLLPLLPLLVLLLMWMPMIEVAAEAQAAAAAAAAKMMTSLLSACRHPVCFRHFPHPFLDQSGRPSCSCVPWPRTGLMGMELPETTTQCKTKRKTVIIDLHFFGVAPRPRAQVPAAETAAWSTREPQRLLSHRGQRQCAESVEPQSSSDLMLQTVEIQQRRLQPQQQQQHQHQQAGHDHRHRQRYHDRHRPHTKRRSTDSPRHRDGCEKRHTPMPRVPGA